MPSDVEKSFQVGHCETSGGFEEHRSGCCNPRCPLGHIRLVCVVVCAALVSGSPGRSPGSFLDGVLHDLIGLRDTAQVLIPNLNVKGGLAEAGGST